MDATNDATLSQDERTAALREAIRGEAFPEWVPESNNHIHTCYSFSPYTPTHAALLARRAGLRVVGSVDHASIAAAPEMTAVSKPKSRPPREATMALRMTRGGMDRDGADD